MNKSVASNIFNEYNSQNQLPNQIIPQIWLIWFLSSTQDH